MQRLPIVLAVSLFFCASVDATAQTPFAAPPPTETSPTGPAATAPLVEPAPDATHTLTRLRRARRASTAGKILVPIGLAGYIGGSVVALLTGYPPDDDSGSSGTGASGWVVAGLGASALWAGSISWGAGELATARRLQDLGADVPEGAGLAAVTCGALNVWICTAIAGPIQHRNNARAGSAVPARAGTPFSLAFVPGRRPMLVARLTF